MSVRRLIRAYLRRRRIDRLKSERVALIAARNKEFRPVGHHEIHTKHDGEPHTLAVVLLESDLGERLAKASVWPRSSDKRDWRFWSTKVEPWLAGAEVFDDSDRDLRNLLQARTVPDHWPVDQIAINLALSRVFGPDESKWPSRERAQALLGVP